MTRAERMTLKHLDLPRRLAHKHPRTPWCFFEVDDLIQIGTLGLIEAAGRWQPRLGPFRPYAAVIIYYRIKDAFRRFLESGPMLSLDAPVGRRSAGRPTVLGDILPARGPSHVDLADARLDVESLLPADERAVILAHYWQGRPLRECLPGRTEGRACQVKTSALSHLRKALTPAP